MFPIFSETPTWVKTVQFLRFGSFTGPAQSLEVDAKYDPQASNPLTVSICRVN